MPSAVMKEWRRLPIVSASAGVVSVPDRVQQASQSALSALWTEVRELASLSALVVCASVGFAQGAAKAAAAASSLTQFTFTSANAFFTTPFVDVLSTSITPPGGKDLFITYSAQTLLIAATVNNSTPALPSNFTSEDIGIRVRVLVDGVPVPISPGSPLTAINFDNTFHSTNQFHPSGFDLLTLVAEEGGAHSYSWIAPDVGVGTHVVTVQAQFFVGNFSFPLGTAFSSVEALMGPKTLTVEQVQLK
jgi:hypothetical protein